VRFPDTYSTTARSVVELEEDGGDGKLTISAYPVSVAPNTDRPGTVKPAGSVNQVPVKEESLPMRLGCIWMIAARAEDPKAAAPKKSAKADNFIVIKSLPDFGSVCKG
jgi:hypothetical protein